MFEGMNDSMGGFIAPNESCKRIAHRIKTLIFLLAALFVGILTLAFITPASFGMWPILQLIALGIGYFAIKDDAGYRPSLMQNFSVFSCIGGVFGAIYFLQELLLTEYIIAATLGITVSLLVVSSQHGWALFLELLNCQGLSLINP